MKFEEFIEHQDQDSYMLTHRKRYVETYSRIVPYIADKPQVAEMGYLSPITRYLRDFRGATATEVTCDLRYDWTVESESFDAVLSFEVIEHIHDQLLPGCHFDEIVSFSQSGAINAFRESYRALRPGGLLIISTPNSNSVDTVANIISSKHPFQFKPHVREYNSADIIEMALDVGFEVLHSENFFAWQLYSDEFRRMIELALDSIGFPIREPGDDLLFVFRKP